MCLLSNCKYGFGLLRPEIPNSYIGRNETDVIIFLIFIDGCKHIKKL